jgi:small subunit ribosomal protein S2
MVAIVDSNCSVDGITYPIPGNDDSSRAIRLYCQLVSDAVLTGLQESLSRSSKDMGEREDAGEIIPVDPAAEKKAQEAKEDADEAKKGKNRGRGGASKKAPVVTVKKTPGKK